MLLQFFTGSTRFLSPYFPPTPCSAAIALTNAMLDAAAADPLRAALSPTLGAEHWSHDYWLRRRDAGIRVTHLTVRDHASLENDLRPDSEHAGTVKAKIRELPDFDAAQQVRHAVGDGRIDRVLCHVTGHAEVVTAVASGVFRERPPLELHLVRGLPRAGHDLPDSAHRLRVARDDRDRSDVVQYILCGDGLPSDARLGERDVLGDVAREMVAHHQHVEVLINRIGRVRPGRVRAARNHIRLAAHRDDVWGMAAPGPFAVVGVQRAPFEGCDRVLDVSALVQGVCVNGHLHVHVIRDSQAGIDRCRRRAPIFVQLEANSTSFHNIHETLRA
eukprot:scaffold1896_cov262-Pinguiococcus_pyrenoidosus.AAC.3